MRILPRAYWRTSRRAAYPAIREIDYSRAAHPVVTIPRAQDGVLTRAGAEFGRQLRAARVVFTNPDLRAAQVALALSLMVDLAQLIALSAYLYVGSGVGAVAAYGVVRAIAPAAGTPLVTATTARLGPARLLTLLGAATAVTAAGITTVVVLDGSLLAVIAMAGLLHVFLGAYRPVTSALQPSLVRTPEELLACTAAAGLLAGATVLAGPLLAGLLLAFGGPAAVLYTTVAMLAAAALISSNLSMPAGTVSDPATTGRDSPVRTFLGTAEVRVLTLLGSTQTFVRGALNVIVVVFAFEVFGLDGSGVGLLLAAIGVGAVVGMPVAYALTGRRLYRALAMGLVLWGLPVAIASVTPNLVVVLVLFAVIGLGNDLVDLGLFSALPRAVPDRVLPQVLGIVEAALQVGMALGAAAAGILLSVADVQIALLAVGSLLPIAVLLADRRLRSFDARLGHRDDEVDLLRRQPMFAVLPVAVLDTVVSRLTTVEFGPGQEIMVEGSPGDRYALIAAGEVTIDRAGAVVAQRQAGDGFGEIALIRNTPRTATARAATAVSARTLDRDTFLAALGYDPRARLAADDVADSRMPPLRVITVLADIEENPMTSTIALPTRPAAPAPPAPTLVGSDMRVPLVTGGNRRYVNLDYAASAPCLTSVKQAVDELLPWYSSVHRGTGYKSQLSTDAYEGARDAVRSFVGGRTDDAVIVTRNTTDGLNLLAAALPPRTEVLVFASEHHANLLPWRRRDVTFLPIPAGPEEALHQLERALSAGADDPRLVAVTGASNVTGEIWPYAEITALAHRYGARVVLDAAQIAPHRRIDMAATGIDYLALSGHKLYAPFGAGALVGRPDWLGSGEPFLAGGGAVRYVRVDDVLWAELPDRQEAGSPNVLGAVALGVACRTLAAADLDLLAAAESALIDTARERLAAVHGVEQYRLWPAGSPRIGVLPFAVRGVSYARVAAVLSAEYGIGVRHGCFCAHPLVARLLGIDPEHDAALQERLRRGIPTALPGAVRASAGLGTTAEDIDRLVDAVTEIAHYGPRWTYRSSPDGTDCRPVPDPRARPALPFDLAG